MKTKNIILLTICLALIGLLSFGVLAQEGMPTFSEMFKNAGSFFMDMFTGSADAEQSYFLIYIAYFILIMAIYVEGLKFLPLFGGKGEINTPGKWFAFAATFLSVAAIFMGEQFTGQSTGEMMKNALAPFGVWAGLAIAGIMTLIIFLATKEADFLKSHTGIRAVTAFSAGLMFGGWFISEPNLIGYGFIIMMIALIIGLFTMFKGGGSNSSGSTSSGGSGGSSSGGGGILGGGEDSGGESISDEDKGKKEAEKLEKFSIAEFAWLKTVDKQLDDEYKKKNGKLGDTKKFKYIKVKREERTLRRMRRRLDHFIKHLNKLENKANDGQKRKIKNWKQKIEVYWKDLIKLEARNGQFDKVLGTLGAKFGAHVSPYIKGDAGRGGGTKAKYLQLKDILKEAIKADTALVRIFENAKKEFKLEEAKLEAMKK